MEVQVDLAIILPCYNPPQGWLDKVLASWAIISTELPVTQLVIVNDGSTTGIGHKHIQALEARIPNTMFIEYPKNYGKGYALRQGVSAVEARYYVYTDIDFPFLENDLLKCFQALLNDEADIIASHRNEAFYKQVPSSRAGISKLFKGFVTRFFRLPVTDTQCGLKGFNQAGRDIFLKTTFNRYLFDLEFLTLASRQKSIRIISLPVTLKPDIILSKLPLGILITEGLNLLRLLIK